MKRIKSSKDLFYSKLDNCRVKCKCSHTMFMPYNENKMICNYCFRTVYRTEKDEFKDKLKKVLKKT